MISLLECREIQAAGKCKQEGKAALLRPGGECSKAVVSSTPCFHSSCKACLVCVLHHAQTGEVCFGRPRGGFQTD